MGMRQGLGHPFSPLPLAGEGRVRVFFFCIIREEEDPHLPPLRGSPLSRTRERGRSASVLPSDQLARFRFQFAVGQEAPAGWAEDFQGTVAGLVSHPARTLHPIAEIDIGQPSLSCAYDMV